MPNICPRDQSNLVAQGTSVPTIYRCENCYGLWFPNSVVAAVIGHAPKSSAAAFQGESVQAAMACPEDGKALVRFLVNGVELDVCSFCEGVWFDRGELEYIQAKKAGTLPSIPEADSQLARTLDGAVGDAKEKLRGVDIDPDVVILTADIGARAIGTAIANPELTGQVAEAVGSLMGGAGDIAGAMPDAVGSAAEFAPDVVGAIFELIAGAFSN